MASYYYSKYSYDSRRKKKIRRRIFLSFTIIFLLIIGTLIYVGYNILVKPNVWTADNKNESIYIKKGSDFSDVKEILYSKGLIIDRKYFEWMARYKKLDQNIHPGHYIIKSKMNNNELVNLLKGGLQTPVNVTFNNIRTLGDLSRVVAKQLCFDSVALQTTLKNQSFLESHQLNPEQVKAIFIPNTYEFYWTISPEDFVIRMQTEYNRFWTKERLEKASQLNLTPFQVSTLASIVEQETNKNDEKRRIAGVYLNRLNKGWLLQADPTLKFALGDFLIKRVLNIHKEIDSPYNTYKNKGLPPAPICLPSIASIDAVLNYEKHDYMFFCANPDFSGYHVFAKTYRQHNRNAKAYQKALNKQKIFK